MAAIVTTSPVAGASATPERLRPVRIWLYAVALLVLMMVALGGITRLTDSGLAITTWQPISGTIPPLSPADWVAEFSAYQAIPEYQLQNRGMTLEEFKLIYWWEWAHRFLGRVIGVAFAVPFLVFLAQRRFSWRLAGPLAALFVLGGLQGAIGWWMVSSGLTQRVDVSQYRLATHLGAATLLFVALIWVARRLGPGGSANATGSATPALLLLALILLQIVAGGFVAGLDAGMAYNTWPLMEGRLVPTGLAVMEPLWRNLFENVAAVQFVHRTLAYVIVGYVGFLLLRQSRAPLGFSGVHRWLPLIGWLVGLQVVLGIATLLASVPISLALGHQALAFMLAGLVTAYIADLTPRQAAVS